MPLLAPWPWNDARFTGLTYNDLMDRIINEHRIEEGIIEVIREVLGKVRSYRMRS